MCFHYLIPTSCHFFVWIRVSGDDSPLAAGRRRRGELAGPKVIELDRRFVASWGKDCLIREEMISQNWFRLRLIGCYVLVFVECSKSHGCRVELLNLYRGVGIDTALIVRWRYKPEPCWRRRHTEHLE